MVGSSSVSGIATGSTVSVGRKVGNLGTSAMISVKFAGSATVGGWVLEVEMSL